MKQVYWNYRLREILCHIIFLSSYLGFWLHYLRFHTYFSLLFALISNFFSFFFSLTESLGIETTSLEHMSVSPEGSRIGFVGSHGYLHIVDSHTKQWTMDMKMNSTLKSMSFLSEYECVSSGFDADIYFWDLRFPNGKCVNKFQHEDGTATSHLTTYLPSQSSSSSNFNYYSLPNAFLSVGAISGVNSIYEGFYQTNSGLHDFSSSLHDDSDVRGKRLASTAPKPLKSVMNLTTKITCSAFHPSGQILAIASNEVRRQ